jgi:hypothetical protein
VLRWAYKKGREIARRMISYRGELESGHPCFTRDSKAANSTTAGPVDLSSEDISYSIEDNEAIDDYHRAAGPYYKTLSWCLVAVLTASQLRAHHTLYVILESQYPYANPNVARNLRDETAQSGWRGGS